MYSLSRLCYNILVLILIIVSSEVWIKRFGIYENRRNRENRRKSLKTHENRRKSLKIQEIQEYRGKSYDLRDTYTKIH